MMDLARRLDWLEREHRKLLLAIDNVNRGDRPGAMVRICMDSRCLFGTVPHVVEEPDLCPKLQ